jgi:uncharacterized protein
MSFFKKTTGKEDYDRGMELLSKGDPKAFDYINKAAKQAYVPAFYQLGRMYDFGRYVEIDKKRAFRWYSEAYNTGFIDAGLPLALLHIKGIYPEDDEEGCLSILEDLFNSGNDKVLERHTHLLYEIGCTMCDGSGSFKDVTVGMEVLHKAAKLGDKKSIEYLERIKGNE